MRRCTELPGAGLGRSIGGQIHLQHRSVNLCLKRTYCIFTCIACPQTKITFFENKLFGEFAFSDNSLWGQRVYIFFKPTKDCRRMLLGSAPGSERRKSMGQSTLLNIPPFQFPPCHWRFSGVYYYLNLLVPAWKYLADFIASWSQSFSLIQNASKLCTKLGCARKQHHSDYKEEENVKIKVSNI